MFNAISAETRGQAPDDPKKIILSLNLGSATQVAATDTPFRITLLNARAIQLYAAKNPLYYRIGDSSVTAASDGTWLDPENGPHLLWLKQGQYLSVVNASVDQDAVLEISYFQEL